MDIREQRVTFEVDGESIVGLLYQPADPNGRGLVFLGPLTSVKEQVPGNYAKAMAARGFTSLAIDTRHFGESGGAPRQYEHPERKAEDLQAAIHYLHGRDDIDKVGAVGICAGAGYSSAAVAGNAEVGAFATVAGFYHDVEQQQAWMGDNYEAAIERAVAARESFEASGEAEMIPAVAEEGGDVAMPLREAYEYYGTDRGAVPNYANEFAVMSREQTLPFDAQTRAATIEVPTLVVHSEKALAPVLARKFYAALAGPKQELWLESKGQIDFYDDPAMIEPVADRLAVHFQTHL